MQINDLEMESSSQQSSSSMLRGSSGAILLLRLILLGFSVNLLHSAPLVSSSGIQTTNANNNPSPLVYTRLRHDINYLQLYRNYQLEHPHEEKEYQLRVNETSDDDDGNNTEKQVVYTYYENKQVAANNITRDDLILESLDRTYKTRLIPAYLYNYDNPADKSRASDPKLVSKPKCRRHLNYLHSKLNQQQVSSQGAEPIDPELAAFFDSYAKEEPGLLFGNYHWTGNWRQCYKRQIFDLLSSSAGDGEVVTQFKGRYCVASIRSRRWHDKIKLKSRELTEAGNYFKYPGQAHDYERFFRIQLGICLPESCDSRTIDTPEQRQIIRDLVLHKLQEPLRSYELVDLFCLPDETSELRKLEPSAWLFIVLSLAWCMAIVMATLYDLKQNSNKLATSGSTITTKSSLDKLVSALSLLRNYHRLTETKSLEPPPPPPPPKQQVASDAHEQISASGILRKPDAVKLAPNDLLFLNAFKVISMPCILFGHTGMLSIMLNRFPLDYEAFENDYLNHFNISSVFFVDWYFVVTGFLASYLAFVTRKVERNTPFQWAYGIFHRYWRLAPMYILLFWFSQSLFQHTASGPVWDYGTSNMTLRGICRRESWIWPVTLASNFHPIHEECIMPAWYIASDMQFFIVTPFILVGLSKWPIGGWLATVGCICMSIMARMIRYMTDPRVQPLELMRPRYDAYMRNNWDIHQTYIYPQYRISSYLIGLLAGHYTFMVLSGKWRSPLYKFPVAGSDETKKSKDKGKGGGGGGGYILPNWGETSRWILRTLVCLWGVHTLFTMMFASKWISDMFPRHLEPQVKYYTAMIYGTSHSTTSLGFAAICVTLMMGQFKWLRKFLSLPIFTLISRVNYFVFLVQVEIIYWLQQSSERVVDLSPLDAFKNWITLAAIVYPMATMATLWLELPLANLEREFIGSWMASRARASVQSSNSNHPKLASAAPAGRSGSSSGSEAKLIDSNDDKNRNKKNRNLDNELANSSMKRQSGSKLEVAGDGKIARKQQQQQQVNSSVREVRID